MKDARCKCEETITSGIVSVPNKLYIESPTYEWQNAQILVPCRLLAASANKDKSVTISFIYKVTYRGQVRYNERNSFLLA